MVRAIEDRGERREVVEQRRDRLGLVREAGFSKVSGVSVAAGVLAACGAFVLLVGVAAAIVRVAGIDADAMSDNDWRSRGAAAGVAGAAALLGAFFLGGYIAGRMARRAGLLHGLLVGAFGIVVVAMAAAIGHLEDGSEAIADRLEVLGAPTAGRDWAGIALVIGAAALVAVLAGGVLGGVRGERWHQRLMDRALDPRFGPEAELGRRQRELEEAERRLEREREEAERRGVLVTSREAPAETETTADATTEATAEEDAPEPEPSPRDSGAAV